MKLGERPERHTHTDLTDNIWSLMEQCWDHYPWNRPKISSVLGILRDWFILFFSRWPSANCSIFIISRNGDKLLIPVLLPAPSNWFAQILGEILDLTDQLASVALFGSVGVGKTFVAHTVLDSDRAKAKFGENRHFMRCDNLTTSLECFMERLADAIHTDVTQLKSHLQSSPPLILLLNNVDFILGTLVPGAKEIYARIEQLSEPLYSSAPNVL